MPLSLRWKCLYNYLTDTITNTVCRLDIETANYKSVLPVEAHMANSLIQRAPYDYPTH